MIKILDIYKNPLYILYQWDINQFVNIIGINPEMPVSVQFWRAGQSEAFVVESTVSGNTVTAAIPNELLREPGELVIYIWQDTGSGEQKGGRTETFFNIPIKERAQPSDYIYDDNVEYISVKTVIEDAQNATTAAQEAAEAATAAAQHANDTAADIKQRADSGEFDGKDGTDGKDGAPGAQGEPGQPGTDGKSATITIGTVTTVSPDTPASVTNTGTATDAIFNFEIPKGQDGSGGGGADLDTLEKIAIKTFIDGNPAMSGSSTEWRVPLIEGYGQSTQGADPTSEAPQEIKSSAVTGVKVTGKNLFNIEKSEFNNQGNFEITKNTALSNTVICEIQGGGVATISFDKIEIIEPSIIEPSGGWSVALGFFYADGTNYELYSHQMKSQNNQLSSDVSKSVKSVYVRNPWRVGQKIYGLQIEYGATATEYEPYKEKTIPLSAPVTLRGIPSETGNVTIDGTKYLSDVIDKEKITRHVGYIASYNSEDVDDLYMSTAGQLTTGATVIYALSEPNTEPLPTEDVQALADLKTFYPTSIISWETEDSAGAWTRVEIIHDPANYIEEKISSAVTQAITLAQGGTI